MKLGGFVLFETSIPSGMVTFHISIIPAAVGRLRLMLVTMGFSVTCEYTR